MGWTCTKAPNCNVTEYLIQHSGVFRWHSPDFTAKVLRHAMVGSTLYAAVEFTYTDGRRRVWASVTLTERQGAELCWKEMDETMGPNADRCPRSILGLLTPLEPGREGYAAEWRLRAWEHLGGMPKHTAADNLALPL